MILPVGQYSSWAMLLPTSASVRTITVHTFSRDFREEHNFRALVQHSALDLARGSSHSAASISVHTSSNAPWMDCGISVPHTHLRPAYWPRIFRCSPTITTLGPSGDALRARKNRTPGIPRKAFVKMGGRTGVFVCLGKIFHHRRKYAPFAYSRGAFVSMRLQIIHR